jgi:hypothetical protein
VRRVFILGVCLTAAAPALAQDRPVFPPQAPFHAVASFPEGMIGDIRYQDGKARIDATSPSGPATIYLDIPARRAVIALSLQGMNMGLEVDLAEFGLPDPASITAEMVGADTALGEHCTRWKFRDPKTGRPGIACITPDGIPLKAQDGAEGSSPAMEVTALERGPQDPAALVPPPDLSTMKATGLSSLPIPLPIPGLGR